MKNIEGGSFPLAPPIYGWGDCLISQFLTVSLIGFDGLKRTYMQPLGAFPIIFKWKIVEIISAIWNKYRFLCRKTQNFHDEKNNEKTFFILRHFILL